MSEVTMTETKETFEALDALNVQEVEMREAGEAAAPAPQMVVVHNNISLDAATLAKQSNNITPQQRTTKYRQRYRREWEDIPHFKGKL